MEDDPLGQPCYKTTVGEKLSTLASYIPAVVVRQCVESQQPLTAPVLTSADAGSLFLDISGFTPLAESLAKLGAEGSEKLTSLLNGYFGRLIRIVHEQKGEVVSFAGDAFVAIWPRPLAGSSATQILHRVLSAAVEMQHAQPELQEALDVSLAFKLGIGVGKFEMLHLGGVQESWAPLGRGSAVERAIDSEAYADPGDIIIAPEAWRYLSKLGQGKSVSKEGHVKLKTDCVILEPEPLEPPKLQKAIEKRLVSYVLPSVRQRLAAGHAGWLGELRRVTVLFGNLKGLTPQTPLEKVHEIVGLVQQEILNVEGSINKLSVDEKGVSLLAVFGLPPISHEKEADRAIAAAIGIESVLRAHDVSTSIGVTTGRAFCGPVGSDLRREYTVIGDVVNLAARLMQAAAGSILVDQDSKKECGDAFEFEDLEPIQVKGKTALIPVARPKTKNTAPTQKPSVAQSHPMIGRHRELRVLREAAKQVNDANACHVYTVLGEAGQGKTSLMRATVDELKRANTLCAMTHASSLESKTPYLSWQNLLWRILAPEASDASEFKTTLENLASGCGLDATNLALVNDITKMGFPETEISQTFSSAERQKRLSDAIILLLEYQAGSKPILLAFEDAQWMDDKSWSLLDLLAPKVRSVLILISLRESAITQAGRDSKTYQNAKDINLPPMSKGEISELIRGLTGHSTISSNLSDLISQKSGGSPYLATEMVRTLQDENLLLVKGDEVSLQPNTDAEHIAFPTTIEGFVNSRIDKLPPREQLLLKVASVLGHSFHQDIIKEIYPVAKERPQVRFLLEKLVTRGFLKHHSERVQALFHFEQSTILEGAYENMLFERRRQIHKASAKWYESHKSNEFQNYLPLIAHHWEAAGHPGKALKYLEKASVDAASSSSHADVIRHASQGLLVAERGTSENDFQLTPARSLRLHRLLADAHFAQGDMATSQDHAQAALDALGLKLSSSTHALGGLQNFVQTSLASRGHGKTKEAILAEASLAASRLAMCFLSEQNEKSMRAAVELSVSLASKSNEHPATTGVLTVAGTVMGAANNHKKALTYFEQAKSVGTKHKNMTAMIQLSEAVASHAIGKGDWDRAKEAINQASKQLKKHGSRQERDRILYARANLSLLKGKFSDAQDRFNQLSEFARRHKGMGIETRALCGLARTHLALGNYVDAEKCIIQATQILELAPNKSLEILCLGLQSTSQLRQGNITSATSNVKKAGDLLRHNTMSHYDTSFSRVFTAEACMDLAVLSKHGKIEHASKHETKAKQALSYLQATARQWLVLQPALKRLQGHWELLHDNYGHARKQLEKSLALSRRFEMRMDEALALMDLGRCRGVSLSQQRQYLSTSQNLLTMLHCHNRALTAQRALDALNQ